MKLNATLLEDVLELAPDAMLIVDTAGTIVYANRQAGTLFELDRDDLVNQSVDLLLPERFRDRHSHHRRRFANDGVLRPMGAGLQLYGQRRDGNEFPVEVSLSPLANGLTAAAIRDVSDRKRVENELIVARETANVAREAADRANLAKSRFLATASHDLRQPLQALAILNGVLRRMSMSGEATKAVLEQQHAIDAMKRLLNALLDISKLEAGAIVPQREHFPLTPVFDELRNEFATTAAEKNLRLQVETTEDYVLSDPSLVEQILRNLLSNAVKYTRRGSVRMTMSRQGERVRVEVIDTGIGIAADKLSLIFDEFFQIGVAANSTREGYGLGLAIVQRIANLLGVKLNVRSTPGKGSIFSLELPLGVKPAATAVAESNNAAHISPAASKQANVLIVEDDERVRNATRLFLELENYNVIAAASRAEALQQLYDGETFDIVVTDYHLEKNETGLDVISSLRAALGREIPAVLVTGDTTAVAAGLPDHHVKLASKPLNPEDLLAFLQSLLEEQENEVRLTQQLSAAAPSRRQ